MRRCGLRPIRIGFGYPEVTPIYPHDMPATPLGFKPLSEAEIQELDDFLLEDRDGAEAMMLDTMDGFLHAVAIGPTTLKPQQWLPLI